MGIIGRAIPSDRPVSGRRWAGSTISTSTATCWCCRPGRRTCPSSSGSIPPTTSTNCERFCATGGGPLDPDTYATPESWEAARLSAGAGLVAIEALAERGADVAFVVARPPGHHALADRSMGFCLINNVAVAAASLVTLG